jgi:hypothetical protein
VKAHGIGNAKSDELSVDERLKRISKIAGGERYIAAQSEGVVLINPRVIARLSTTRVRHILELRSGKWIKRPALGTVLARRCGPVERPRAFAPVEAGKMSARQ